MLPPLYGPVVDHHIVYIHIANHVHVHAIHCGVVVEITAVPVATIVPISGVSKPVINAAIEPDMQSPETMVEAISVADVSPIPRSPQRARIRRRNPASRNPVVTSRPPPPVPRRPQIVRVRSRRLIILRQRRRRISRLSIRQIARIQVHRLLIVSRLIIRLARILRVWITRIRRLPHNRRSLLLRTIILALLLPLVLNILSQRLCRLRRSVGAVTARRRHIRISRIARILIYRAGGSTLRGRTMTACEPVHHGQSKPKLQHHLELCAASLAFLRLQTARS